MNIDVISEKIDDGFIDKNDWLKGVYYDFNQQDDCPVLQIGGQKWANYKNKNNWTKNDEDNIEPKLLASFGHSKILEDELIKWKNQQQKTEWQIVISAMVLDDWKSLFLTLNKHNITVTKLVLGDQNKCQDKREWLKCYFTEMGFETLIWVLNPRQSGFRFQRVDFGAICVHQTFCKKYIPLFSNLPIKSIELRRGPSWLRSLFWDHCECWMMTHHDKLRHDDFGDDRYDTYFAMSMEMKKAVELPEKIVDDFFEKNEMGKHFYKFDECCNNEACLAIGGSGWRQYRGEHDWNEEIMFVESKLLEAFVQSKILLDRLVLWKKKTNQQITEHKPGWKIEYSHSVWQDWKSLLLAFSKHNVPVNKLTLYGINNTTKKGVQTRCGPYESGFQIEELELRGGTLSIKCPKARETNTTSNKLHFIKKMIIDIDWETATPTDLDLLDEILSSTRVGSLNISFNLFDWDAVVGSSAASMISHGKQGFAWAMNLCRSPQFQIEKMNFHVNVKNVKHTKNRRALEIAAKQIKIHDHPSTFFPLLIQQRRIQSLIIDNSDDNFVDHLELEMDIKKPSESNDVSDNENLFIHQMQVSRYGLDRDEYELIRKILCTFRVGSLKLDIQETLWEGDDLDLFAGAKGCREIEIEYRNKIFYGDGLASMIQEGGYLNKLCLRDNCCNVTEETGRFLRRVDLSFLDTFEIGFDFEDDRDVFLIFCRQLKKNKGPRNLRIANYRWCHNVDNPINEVLIELEASLCGNTKIERLDIDFHHILINNTLPLALLQFIERVVCDGMPRLSSFELQIKVLELENKAEDKMIWRMMDGEQERKRIVFRKIAQNKNIQQLRLPFDDEGLGQMLDDIPKYRTLLCCGNEISDGIWPRALGRIKMTAPTLMYHVVLQVPRIFQPQARDDDDVEQQPMYTVPHHPNCPACRAQKALWINEQPKKKKRKLGE